jgi:outer membrane lipoprotein-sorting protein
MTRRLFHQLLPAICLARPCFAGNDAKELLQELARRYQGLKSYRFDGKTIRQSIINGRTSQTETGFTVAFEAPAKFRLEFLYPNAGNWLRVSDGTFLRESRWITKKSRMTPAKRRDLNVLKSSPLYNFQRLSETAINPMIMRSEFVEVNGQRINCDLVQFEAGRRRLRKNERPGPSMVWISRADGLVMREELRTSAKKGSNLTETRRITSIERFTIEQPLPASVFDPKRPDSY